MLVSRRRLLPMFPVLAGGMGILLAGAGGAGRLLAAERQHAAALQPALVLVFALDVGEVAAEHQDAVLRETVRVFTERLASLGLEDAGVEAQTEAAVEVSLPDGADVTEIGLTLGRRGLIEFREKAEDGVNWKPLHERDATGELRPITSASFVRHSRVTTDTVTGRPLVNFEFDDEGAQLFEAATRRLLRQPLAIFYDDELVTASVVQSVISREGVIAGLTLPEARRLVVQLNSGALPVNVRFESAAVGGQ